MGSLEAAPRERCFRGSHGHRQWVGPPQWVPPGEGAGSPGLGRRADSNGQLRLPGPPRGCLREPLCALQTWHVVCYATAVPCIRRGLRVSERSGDFLILGKTTTGAGGGGSATLVPAEIRACRPRKVAQETRGPGPTWPRERLGARLPDARHSSWGPICACLWGELQGGCSHRETRP